MVSKFSRLALYAALVLGGTCAQADPFDDPASRTLTFNPVGLSYSFSDGSEAVDISGYRGIGGQFQGYFGDATADNFFRFFCIELGQYTVSSSTYTRSAFGDDSDEAARARQLSWLFDKYYPNKSAEDFLGGSLFGSFGNDSQESAAMQLSVWEIMFETSGSLGLATGSFRAYSGTDGGARADADAMLDYVSSQVGSAGGWRFYQFADDVFNTDGRKIGGHQNYISATYDERIRQQGGPLPLPGTLALLGAGLAGVGLARRKSGR